MARQNLQHPTNLLGLAAEVRARGHEATLLDMEVVPGGLSAFERAVVEGEPDLVGLSVVTPHVPGARDLARLARITRPGVFLIAGGPHATALPADLLSEIPALDAICVGEGDLTLPEVCDALGALSDKQRATFGREDALTGIPGLVLREHGRTGAREPLMDLDVLAPIDRSLLDWPAYERLAGSKGVASPGVIRGGIRATQIHLSRGCYANCVFCSRTPSGASARGPASGAARWRRCWMRSTASWPSTASTTSTSRTTRSRPRSGTWRTWARR
jgi:radical SAM superfamily enzyme YgiQ (UPF0313 family)